MLKRKLEGTIQLDPQNKIGSLAEFRRMVNTRRAGYPISDPGERDILNNLIIRAYTQCKKKGAGEDEIKVAASGRKEARL